MAYLRIDYRPFDLSLTLTMGQALRWSSRDPDGWHTGVVRGKLIRLRQDNNRLEFRTSAQEESDGAMLRDYLGLDEDIQPVHDALTGCGPKMAELVQLYGGMRLLRQEPWETLITYMISPRHKVERIAQAVEQLAGRFGEPVSLDGVTRNSFPAQHVLAEAGPEGLGQLRLGLPRHAEYIYEIARDITQEGRLDLDALPRMPYGEAKKRLMKCKGIGHKVGDCVLLFSLGKQEAFPLDTNIRHALREFCGLEGTDPTLRGWARDEFGEYAGYASQLLFHGKRDGAIGPRPPIV